MYILHSLLKLSKIHANTASLQTNSLIINKYKKEFVKKEKREKMKEKRDEKINISKFKFPLNSNSNST